MIPTTFQAAHAVQAAVWTDLRANGPATLYEVADRIGVKPRTARNHLQALAAIGRARRTTSGYGVTLPPRRIQGVRLPDLWAATGEPPEPPEPALTCRDAVRRVLAAGPVVGQAEIARRTGYCQAWVAVALAEVATAERIGRGWRCRYTLREGL